MSKLKINLQLNGMEHIFRVLFLTPEGVEATKQGRPLDQIEHYQVRPVVINLTEVESYYETTFKYYGQTCCNINLRSGVLWTVVADLAEILELRKSPFWFDN